jgi:hypothetical protein
VPLFSIAKSENKNQVEYLVRVDDRCVPIPRAPVSARWRMLEEGPHRVAPLLPREQGAYGIASQTADTQGEVRVVLRALPSRPIVVQAARAKDGSCHARAKVTINGAPAFLFNVYLKLKGFSVSYLLLRGWAPDGTRVVTEKLTP